MRPIYAVDSSTTKTYERIASVSERKISKRIHGSVMDGNQRRIRTNSEVYDLYKDLDIIRIVKIFQLVAQVYRLKDHLDLKTQIKIDRWYHTGSKKPWRKQLDNCDKMSKPIPEATQGYRAHDIIIWILPSQTITIIEDPIDGLYEKQKLGRIYSRR